MKMDDNGQAILKTRFNNDNLVFVAEEKVNWKVELS